MSVNLNATVHGKYIKIYTSGIKNMCELNGQYKFYLEHTCHFFKNYFIIY